MPRFVFSLESVLRFRERTENERQRDHAAAQRELQRVVSERDDLIARRTGISDELRAEHRGLDVDTLRAGYAHLEFLTRRIIEADQVIAVHTQEVERTRQLLVAASQERQVLEKLKERKRETYELEALAHEQRELDDTNARRFSRAAAQEKQIAI